MVRLREQRANSWRVRLKFQFQYGTIKRSLDGIGFQDLITFQFQYGTIKRL